MIPYEEVRYDVSAQGSRVKIVHCEKCSRDYVYFVTLTVRRASASVDRAEESARRTLLAALNQAVLPVPCPFCGLYQRNMIPIVQQRRYRWLGWVSLGLVALGVFALVCSCGVSMGSVPDGRGHALVAVILCWAVALVAILASPVVLLIKRRVSRRFDPNGEDDVEERKEMGRSRAISLEDFQKMAQD
jgi:hypothetical protein